MAKITTLHGEIDAPPAPHGSERERPFFETPSRPLRGRATRRGVLFCLEFCLSTLALSSRHTGELDVVDESGILVRSSGRSAGGLDAKRKSSIGSALKGKKTTAWKINPLADRFWDGLVPRLKRRVGD